MDCSLPGCSPWDSPGKSIAVGCHSLLQGIFPTQGLNLSLLHCRQIFYHWATREAQNHKYWLPITIPFYNQFSPCPSLPPCPRLPSLLPSREGDLRLVFLLVCFAKKVSAANFHISAFWLAACWAKWTGSVTIFPKYICPWNLKKKIFFFSK